MTVLDPNAVAQDMAAELSIDFPPLVRMSKSACMAIANAALVESGAQPLTPLQMSSFPMSAAIVAERYDVDEGGEGGGDRPDWVPANAVIHIDLVRAFNDEDAAWTAADGIVAVDTLLGADANTENAWAESGYDPADLTADGLLPDPVQIQPALIGSARSAVMAGATVRWEVSQITGSEASVIIMAADGNDAVQIDIQPNSSLLQASSYGGGLDLSIPSSINAYGEGRVNSVAFTITGSRLDVAANGSDPETAAFDADDRPVGNPFVAIQFEGADSAHRKITLYDALPSTAGLSELSETGVTNTSPHGMTNTNPSALEVSGAVAPWALAIPISGFSVIDDEGNPITWELSDNHDGLLQISEGGDITNADTMVPGDYDFTLRATDPGGLYSERVYTITVTE
jgi:hypothetical protein